MKKLKMEKLKRKLLSSVSEGTPLLCKATKALAPIEDLLHFYTGRPTIRPVLEYVAPV